MPSKASRQFNELYNGIKNGTSTGSVPKEMRDAYQKSLIDAFGNPRDPRQIYDKNGISIGVKGKTGPTELQGFGGIDNSSLSGYINYTGGFTVERYPTSRDSIEYPSDVTSEGNIINVPNGSIVNAMGGFNISSEKKGFFLGAGYNHVKNVKDSDGILLWENRNEKINKQTPDGPVGNNGPDDSGLVGKQG